MAFGNYIREKRQERRKAGDRDFSQRQLALRIEVEPSYLSKVERGLVAPPSEEKILRLAEELEVDPDLLLGLAGKVATELKEIIRERPLLFGRLIRELKGVPAAAVMLLTERVERGDW